MQVTDTVRVVRTAGLIRTVFLATVLSVQPPNAEDDGTNGEPTLTIAYLDPQKKSMLGGADWHKAFTRVTGVRHASHVDVQKCGAEYCWTDGIKSEYLDTGIEMDDLTQPPVAAAEPVSTIGTIVYINHNNGLEVFHGGENLFRVHHNESDHDFTDLFSAQTYVDAQPEPKTDTQPSAADLDAAAAELAAKDATEGSAPAVDVASTENGGVAATENGGGEPAAETAAPDATEAAETSDATTEGDTAAE